MKKAIVIPARKGSTRLKDKLLLSVNGKPVIAWTVENCLKTDIPVIVACDSQEFVEILKDYPIEIILTPSDLKSGSDRIAYAVKDKDLDYIVNVQGDEPLIEPGDIVKLFDLLKDSSVATLYYPIQKEDDYLNPNIVKVISDKDDFAIYFSRSPIPFYRDLDFNQMLKTFTPKNT
jgi:CMP-2-keto-3-deoxyoctulosonic acid synthetase